LIQVSTVISERTIALPLLILSDHFETTPFFFAYQYHTNTIPIVSML